MPIKVIFLAEISTFFCLPFKLPAFPYLLLLCLPSLERSNSNSYQTFKEGKGVIYLTITNDAYIFNDMISFDNTLQQKFLDSILSPIFAPLLKSLPFLALYSLPKAIVCPFRSHLLIKISILSLRKCLFQFYFCQHHQTTDHHNHLSRKIIKFSYFQISNNFTVPNNNTTSSACINYSLSLIFIFIFLIIAV